MDSAGIAHVCGALVGLLGLGLTMGFSPTLSGISLHILGRDPHPGRSIGALSAGLAAGATLLMLIFRTVDPETWIKHLQVDLDGLLLQQGVDLIAAAAFVLTGIAVLIRSRRHPRTPRKTESRQTGVLPLIGIGFTNAVVGTSGPATMYVTWRVLRNLSDEVAWQAAGYLVFLIALVGPYLLVAWAWRRFPSLSTWFTKAQAWISARDFRPVIGWCLIAVGIVFAVLGSGVLPRTGASKR